MNVAKRKSVATASDVAAYILKKLGPLPAMKLQKLVYYCQAWSLVWDERPLFAQKIEAWANGPVIPALYDQHRAKFQVRKIDAAKVERLDETGIETIDAVLNHYGEKSSQWLSDLTHKEKPWLAARRDLRPGEPSRNEIAIDALAEYYGSL